MQNKSESIWRNRKYDTPKPFKRRRARRRYLTLVECIIIAAIWFVIGFSAREFLLRAAGVQ